MSRTTRLVGGLRYGYLNQAVLILAGLFLTPFYLRHLGQERYGLWLIASQVLAYLALTDLGVVGLLPREAGAAIGRSGGWENSGELRRTLADVFAIVFLQLPIAAAAAAAVWAFLPARWSEARTVLLVMLVGFLMLFPLRVFNATLQGLQELRFLGRTQFVVWIASTLWTVLLVVFGYGLFALISGWLLAQLLGATLGWVRLRSRFPGLLPARLTRPSWPSLRRYFSNGAWLSVGQISNVLVTSTDLLVIGGQMGAGAVVPYSCTGKLVTVFANQPDMLMQLAIPGLAELRQAGEKPQVVRATTALTQGLLLLSGAVAVIVLACNRNFVSWWVGKPFFAGMTLTSLIVARMLLRHWNTSLVFSLLAFGHERRLAVTGFAEGVLTVLLSLLLVFKLGLIGAPLASLVAMSFLSLPLNLAALARTTSSSVTRMTRTLWPWGWRLALLIPVALAAHRLAGDGFAYLAAAAALSFVVYTAVVLPLAAKDPLVQYVRPQMELLVKRFPSLRRIPLAARLMNSLPVR